jgi:hypothetical protein
LVLVWGALDQMVATVNGDKPICMRVFWLACAAILLSIALPARAAPTVDMADAIVDWTVAGSADLHSHNLHQTSPTNPSNDSVLAAVAEQLFRLPTDDDASVPSASTTIATFPAVPGAFYLALTGFLTVLLGRNRKAVPAAFIALFCLSQTATHAATRLARSALSEKHCRKHSTPELSHSHHLVTVSAMRRVFEAGQCANPLASSSAIMTGQYELDAQSRCLSSTGEDLICFSPAFILDNLPRGPPEPAQDNVFNVLY